MKRTHPHRRRTPQARRRRSREEACLSPLSNSYGEFATAYLAVGEAPIRDKELDLGGNGEGISGGEGSGDIKGVSNRREVKKFVPPPFRGSACSRAILELAHAGRRILPFQPSRAWLAGNGGIGRSSTCSENDALRSVRANFSM